MNRNNYTVYKHTSPSNKVYIGITSIGVERRWQSGNNYRSNTYFTNAILKYGWDNFKHEILYTGLSKEEAEQKEIELIAFYKSNSQEYGYNIENGGNTHKVSETTKLKLSIAHKGKHYAKRRKHTEEEKKAISNKLKGRTSPMKGKHWSVEQRANVGTSIICNQTGQTFYSIREASRVLGVDRANIKRCLDGKYKQTNGFTFDYQQ